MPKALITLPLFPEFQKMLQKTPGFHNYPPHQHPGSAYESPAVHNDHALKLFAVNHFPLISPDSNSLGIYIDLQFLRHFVDVNILLITALNQYGKNGP